MTPKTFWRIQADRFHVIAAPILRMDTAFDYLYRYGPSELEHLEAKAWRFHFRPNWWLPWQRSLLQARGCAERWITTQMAQQEAIAQMEADIATQMADADELDSFLETL